MVAGGWGWGHRTYDASATAAMVDDQGAGVALAADSKNAVTVECAGPLSPPDPRVHVVTQAVGFAAAGGPSHLVVDDNPCLTARSDARTRLFALLAAAAIAAVVALVALRTRTPDSPTVPE